MPRPGRWINRATEQLDHAEAVDSSDHEEHVAVGEVQQLLRVVDERVTEQDQGVDVAEPLRVSWMNVSKSTRIASLSRNNA